MKSSGVSDAEAQEALLRKKHVLLTPIGNQTGEERISDGKSSRADDGRRGADLPSMRDWRLNLTRLSHVHNLFYAAYRSQVYVYRPSFPDQKLPPAPALILVPPRSPHATSWGIDFREPHSINHLFLDFLGELEVILVACDDGDVVGYYTDSVESAIDSNRYSDAPSAHKIEPFFHLNVRASAWGLSVHTKSRKIAISANSHRVTVVTLGLHKASSGDPSIHEIDGNNGNARDRDEIVIYAGMLSNIPSVAFCNTDQDTQGLKLVTGEITGCLFVHDLSMNDPVEIVRFGFCRWKNSGEHAHCECGMQGVEHAVWCLSFIDKKSFRLVSRYAPSEEDAAHYCRAWDGSMMPTLIPDSGFKYRIRADRNQPTDDSSAYSSDADIGEEPEWIARLGVDLQGSQARSWARPGRLVGLGHPWIDTVTSVSRADGRAPDDPWFNIMRAAPESILESTRDCSYLSPLFVAAKYDIGLLQPRDQETTKALFPVITMNNPLEQQVQYNDTIPPPHLISAQHDRMSLHAVIPELGVLVVGSPTGRVAVFSLLRTDDYVGRADSTYFMRLDWLLPLKSQEDRGERPEKKLLGLTVGPMQGQLGPTRLGVMRQWRLMLYHADHTVLSYELRLPD